MDKNKKTIAIAVFVVFIGVIGIFVKSKFFAEEKVVKKEFTIGTPDIEEAKLDSVSKIDLYNKEAYTIGSLSDRTKNMFADDVTKNDSVRTLLHLIPLVMKMKILRNTEDQITDEEQMSAEQELMELLRAQAEIDAKAQDNLLKAPTQYASQYVPEKRPVAQQNSYNQNAPPVEAEPVKPPSLSEKWDKIKSQKNAFKGVAGFSNAPDGLDLIPAESVDRQVLKLNSTIAFRLKKELYLPKKNLKIPKDAVLYGKTSFGGLDRMNINIASYKTNKKIYSVSLQIYDFDGRPGIHLGNNALPKIPARVAKEVANYVKQRGLQPPVLVVIHLLTLKK